MENSLDANQLLARVSVAFVVGLLVIAGLLVATGDNSSASGSSDRSAIGK